MSEICEYEKEIGEHYHSIVPMYAGITARDLHADHDRTEKRTKPSILRETAAQDLNPNLDREKGIEEAPLGGYSRPVMSLFVITDRLRTPARVAQDQKSRLDRRYKTEFWSVRERNSGK